MCKLNNTILFLLFRKFIMSAAQSEALQSAFACIHDDKDDQLLQMLFQNLFTVNAKNESEMGKTVLHEAALFNRIDLVKKLVNEFNADINIRDNNNFVPMQVAVDSNNVDITRFLLEKGSVEAEYSKHLLNEPDLQKFFDAVEANDIALVKQIMAEKKLDVNALDKTHFNRSALGIAATKGFEDMVKLLVEQYNAEINQCDDIGELPLHNSADNGHLSITKYLVEKGSNNAEDVQELLA